MPENASAYLSVFDDWDILPVALRSVYDRVDEIVVVDGGYTWLAPFFRDSGRDPARSVQDVYEALSPFEPKLRFLHDIWPNEKAKRRAGFEACRHRYVYRIDADEVLFFDDAALDRFFTSGSGVAAMDMPIYLAPGWIRGRGAAHGMERQTFLFDRNRVDGLRHLDYLWLVTAKEDGERPPADASEIFGPSIAFNAHLTQWRTPASALTRARFYVLNHIREHGRISWAPDFRYQGPDSFARLFAALDPGQFSDILRGHPIVAGPIDLDGIGVQPTPLSAAQEESFAHLHTAHRYALAQSNRDLAERPRTLAVGEGHSLDISTPAARRALGDGSSANLVFETPIRAVQATVHWITTSPPFAAEQPVEPALDGGRISVPLPQRMKEGALSATLRLSVWPVEGCTARVRAERQALAATA
ncbi:MAG: hypothetical protein JOY70_01015 [Acidisphaera sp.]|nr:hypothetical protein [Acidisphaera sp.]